MSPILNYTTTVEAAKTAAEIQDILAKKGALGVSTDYANGRVTGLTFDIEVAPQRIVTFRLPVQPDPVFAILKKMQKRPSYYSGQAERDARLRAQAERIAWRILKDWVDAQMALIEVGMVKLEQVFLPYGVTPNGQTFYDRLKGSGFLMLNEGKP